MTDNREKPKDKELKKDSKAPCGTGKQTEGPSPDKTSEGSSCEEETAGTVNGGDPDETGAPGAEEAANADGTDKNSAQPEHTEKNVAEDPQTDNKESGEAAENGSGDEKDKRAEELLDKYKRLFAEFDNFRKRTDSEKSMLFAEGERAVLLKVLPLIDNFERALDNIPEDLKGNPYVDGVEKIYSSFMALLGELGVEPIEAKGKPFDANLHNAVMHAEDPEQPENTVTDEFQKGYMFRGKVLRYSMVKVVN